MANGSYAHAYEDLDIVPSLPNKPASAYCAMYTASNDASRADNDFVVTLNNNANADISTFVAGAFIRGDYACGGFKIPLRDFAMSTPVILKKKPAPFAKNYTGQPM